ncbi:MAG: undecaprenyl-diphosphate phosphatase [Actinomycetota bacterium]
MSLLAALILGIVQGLTEFLPISSSGHLLIVPWALGIDEPTLAFATALHLGTLVGVVVALRPEIGLVIRTLTGWSGASSNQKLLVKLLFIGSIPAVVVGVAGQAVIGDAFDRPVLAAFLLLVTGYLLTSTEARIEHAKIEPDRQTVNQKDAWAIGGAQALAILPGISRSGATIVAGMRLGLSREAAARYSFLLAVPVIAGAVVLELPDMVSQGAFGEELPTFAIGVAAAAASGWWALRWFLSIIGRVGIRGFGRYCYLAGAVALLLAMARG